VDDLIAFLNAQLDKRERAAKAMKAVYPTPWEVADRGWMARVVADGPNFLEVIRLEQGQVPDAQWLGDVIQHVALNDPDFVLADVAAKRQIIEAHPAGRDHPESEYYCTECGPFWRDGKRFGYPCETLRLLALPYASHPDYRMEWKP
jgi:hypothetical protein